MMQKSALPIVLMLTLGGCSLLPEQAPPPVVVATPPTPARPHVHESGAEALLVELARVATLTPDQRRRELAERESGRIDDTRRFQLAALLDREDSVDALERALKHLNALADVDVRAQPLIDQMKKSFKARIELKQQALRVQELQEKLEQIKALEKSLQQRSVAPKAP